MTSTRRRALGVAIVMVAIVQIAACSPTSVTTPTGLASVSPGPSAASPTRGAPTPSAVATPQASASPPAAASRWVATTPMHEARQRHTATRLLDGRVLVVGGDARTSYLASTETFDPVTGMWTEATPLGVARGEHAAVMLADGRVLVAGGITNGNGAGELTDVAEVFDPTTGAWSRAGTSLGHVHGAGSGVALPDGSALFHATIGEGFDLDSILQRFDADDATWTRVARLPDARIRPSLVVLAGGRVLIAGGSSARSDVPSPEADAWVYDPATDAVEVLPDMPEPSFDYTAVRLADDRVFVPGGRRSSVFDPHTEVWTRTSRAGYYRDGQVAARLADGRIVLAGSTSCHNGADGSEIYDAVSDTWVDVGRIYPYMALSMTELADGRVLLAGGGLPCDANGDGIFGPFADAFILDGVALD